MVCSVCPGKKKKYKRLLKKYPVPQDGDTDKKSKTPQDRTEQRCTGAHSTVIQLFRGFKQLTLTAVKLLLETSLRVNPVYFSILQ